EKRVFLVILFTSFSGSLVSRIPGAVQNENTSYSQIVTECRMRYAVQMLLMDNKNITQVAQLCGYSSTSYFISVFKAFYGLTPLNYLAKQRQKVMW
uniref:helix-turn-helix domain-containing protein n=1 Tax=Escherichia coli TaxID=562 RepID=UPI001FCE84E9